MGRKKLTYEAVVIGTSAGGLEALGVVLPRLKPDLSAPIFIVQHISASSESYLVDYFDRKCQIKVFEAVDKLEYKPGKVYFAPPDYHLLIEDKKSIALSVEEKVNYSRPSIDVLFETASWHFGPHLIGIVLTGANWDGASGLKTIKEAGGMTIVENPKTAAVPRMPESAIELCKPDYILKLDAIANKLNHLLG
jgi:two-component system chemotaxis response regulator CheB